MIDIIDKHSMRYVTARVNIKGGFGHDLYFKWLKLTPLQQEVRRRDVTTPITTPTDTEGAGEIRIAAIDNGLAFPFKHPDEWRTCESML